MDTRELRCFRLVYEEKSLNKAAGPLFITPQGLSRVIKKLESELQTELFERTSGGMIPTESGDYLYEQSQDLLYRLEDLKRKMLQLGSRQSRFRIGFACGSLNVLHLEQLSAFKEHTPGLTVEWEEMENQQVSGKLLDNTLDAGFLIGAGTQSELAYHTVYTGRITAYVYEGHPFYERESISIRDLQGQPIISLGVQYACYRDLIQRCSDFGFTPNIVIHTMESGLIYRFCAEKLGIGIDADIHPDRKLQDGLKKVAISDALPWTVALACRKENADSEIMKRLFSLISR